MLCFLLHWFLKTIRFLPEICFHLGRILLCLVLLVIKLFIIEPYSLLVLLNALSMSPKFAIDGMNLSLYPWKILIDRFKLIMAFLFKSFKLSQCCLGCLIDIIENRPQQLLVKCLQLHIPILIISLMMQLMTNFIGQCGKVAILLLDIMIELVDFSGMSGHIGWWLINGRNVLQNKLLWRAGFVPGFRQICIRKFHLVVQLSLETIEVIIAYLTLLFYQGKALRSEPSKSSLVAAITKPIVSHAIILRQYSLIIVFQYLLHLRFKGVLIYFTLKFLFESQGGSLNEGHTLLVLFHRALVKIFHALSHIIDFPIQWNSQTIQPPVLL